MAVLTTTGVQSEAHLPFAGLHQLLRPVRERAARAAASPARRARRRVRPDATRRRPSTSGSRWPRSTSLSDVAGDAPLLLVVEDAHWLDRPTADVLAFVARRIESDPIVAAGRRRATATPSALVDAGLPEHRLAGARRRDGRGVARRVALRASRSRPCARAARGGREPARAARAAGGGGGREDEPRRRRRAADRAARARVRRPRGGAARCDASRSCWWPRSATTDASTRSSRRQAPSPGPPLDLEPLSRPSTRASSTLDLQTIRFRHPLIRSAVAPERRPGGAPPRARGAGRGARRPARPARVAPRGAAHRRARGRRASSSKQAGSGRGSAGAVAVAVTALRRAARARRTGAPRRRLLAAAGLAVRARPAGLVGRAAARGRASWMLERAGARAGHVGRGDCPDARRSAAERVRVARSPPPSRPERRATATCTSTCSGSSPRAPWWVDPGAEARRRADRRRRTALGDADADGPARLRDPRLRRPVGPRRRGPRAPARAAADGAARRGAPRASSARPRSSSARSTSARLPARRRSTGCGTEGRLGAPAAAAGARTRCMAARLGRLGRGDHRRRGGPAAGRRSSAEPQLARRGRHGRRRWSPRCAATSRRPSVLAARAELVALPVGATHHGRVRPVREGAGRARLRPPRRRVRIRRAAVRPGRLGLPPGDLVVADRAISPRPRAHVDRLEAARARVAQVEAIVGERPGTWIALGAPPRPGAGRRAATRGRRALRGGARRATSTRWPFQRAPAPARLRPVAAAPAARRRVRGPSCAPRATRSTRSGARRGATRPGASCARRASAAGAACPRRATS